MSGTDRGADAARDYFTAVETEFIRLRGSPFLLSPKDFILIRRWRDLGIPLSDVLLGISEAFDRRQERGAITKINSVGYCEGAILEAWERNASARVGKAAAPADDLDAAAALDRLALALGAASRRRPETAAAIARAAKSVSKLADSGQPPEKIESSLARVEKKLLREVAELLPGEELAAIEAGADRRLASDRETMESRAYERTRDILIRRKLREELGVPRLSLLG